ncbi:MAG: transposase [Chloroflexota bacterium]|nr:transposase [Chloroflexota bacterium]
MPSSTWPINYDPSHLYFVTSKAIKGKHIFHRDVIKRILVDSLNTGRILGQYKLFAFVIMPNHIHVILQGKGDYSIQDIVREFKKSTSNLIVRQLELENNHKALNQLEKLVPQGVNQKYVVWEHEYQAKDIFSQDFLAQKLDYIHHNPLQPHWLLVENPEDYVWSSARYYSDLGRALIPLSDVRDLLV